MAITCVFVDDDALGEGSVASLTNHPKGWNLVDLWIEERSLSLVKNVLGLRIPYSLRFRRRKPHAEWVIPE